MKHTEFDLPAFLLSEIYAGMDKKDVQSWSREEAANLAHDLNEHDGIACDPDEIYEIISEFILEDESD